MCLKSCISYLSTLYAQYGSRIETLASYPKTNWYNYTLYKILIIKPYLIYFVQNLKQIWNADVRLASVLLTNITGICVNDERLDINS